MPARHIIALWETVHEPRAVTITYMIMYALAATAGATIAANPRHGILTGAPPWVVVVIVAMLIAGGLVGVPVAWRGDRWLERSVVIMVGSAIGLMLLNATMIAPHIAPLSLLLAGVVAAAIVPRWMTVTSLTYAPGRGPLTPADEALIEYREA